MLFTLKSDNIDQDALGEALRTSPVNQMAFFTYEAGVSVMKNYLRSKGFNVYSAEELWEKRNEK